MRQRATHFEFATAAQKGAPNRQSASIADDFSLVVGGPFYGILQRMGLFKSRAPHATHCCLAGADLAANFETNS
jgi:hypothetical protein